MKHYRCIKATPLIPKGTVVRAKHARCKMTQDKAWEDVYLIAVKSTYANWMPKKRFGKHFKQI